MDSLLGSQTRSGMARVASESGVRLVVMVLAFMHSRGFLNIVEGKPTELILRVREGSGVS